MRLTSLTLLRSAVAPLLLTVTGCHHDTPAPAPKAAATPAAKGPSEEDIRVARNALTIRDVVGELRAGVPKEKVLADVKQRHLTSLAVESSELELAANGAGHELLAALKDPSNLLSPMQEAAYTQTVARYTAEKPRAATTRR